MGRQLDLGFRDATPAKKRGGARVGAGRPRKADADRKRLAHCTRPSHRKGDPVHVTVRVVKALPSLRRQLLEQIIKRALLMQRATAPRHFQVVHFSIQSDHVHLLVEAPDKRGLARGMAGLEVRIARRINRVLRRKGRFWSDRYHRRDLRTPTETRHALRYVLNNLRKHARVVGEGDFADPHSSAATFDGFSRPPYVFDDPLRWPPVTPRTWLLGVGWRRHGLIDPSMPPPAAARRPA